MYQPKPPPVIIDEVENYSDVQKLMNDNHIKYQAMSLNSVDIKINIPDSENY